MRKNTLTIASIFMGINFCLAQDLPKILSDKQVQEKHYIPDYSYAGYHFSEEPVPHDFVGATFLDVETFGAKPNDGIDDTKAVMKALKEAEGKDDQVIIRFSKGRFILSEILYITRSNIVLTGAGSGINGTTLYFPRPMRYLKSPKPLTELREYLIALDKRQREPENNLDLPFSQYAWSGGFIWVQVSGERVKKYLEKYDKESIVLTEIVSGLRGSHEIIVENTKQLKVGDVVQIEWFNKGGKNGSLIAAIYDNADVTVGSHHWNYPNHSIVQQQALITGINSNKIQIKDVLLHDITSYSNAVITPWKHVKEVGIQHFNIEFPDAPNIAHHVEDGYNAIYLTNLYNGWVTDVVIKNADSGILTEQTANVTISDISTTGEKKAHYSVSMGSVHNVLVQNLTVYNEVTHPLSFNTHATKSVYKDCIVYADPILDQHSGANHQNLFDSIKVYIDLSSNQLEYPLFAGGGAGYWKPSHGAFTTFWNIKAYFNNGFEQTGEVLLNGMKDGPSTRLIGVSANRPIRIKYGPDAYIEQTNNYQEQVPSLFTYQLNKRLTKK